jgi:hypothetical protein
MGVSLRESGMERADQEGRTPGMLSRIRYTPVSAVM